MMMSGFALMIVGSLMTLLSSLFGIIIGIAFITTGFFITHSLTSSSVGAESKQAKAHASSLYLLFTIWVQVLSVRQVVGSGYTVAGVRLSLWRLYCQYWEYF